MTPVQREQQVGLLGLGGEAGRWAATLDVDDDEGNSIMKAREMASLFSAMPGRTSR